MQVLSEQNTPICPGFDKSILSKLEGDLSY